MHTRQKVFESIFDSFNGKRNESLAVHTALRVGGPAEYYIEVDSVINLQKVISAALRAHISVTVLGSGSNILVSDSGVTGLVIKNNCRKFDVYSMIGKITNRQMGVSKLLVASDTGALLNQVVRFTLDQGLTGLENVLGLPGTVGGFLQLPNSVRERIVDSACIHSARVMRDGELIAVGAEYFTGSEKTIKGDVVVSVIFSLSPADKNSVWQKATITAEKRMQEAPVERQSIYVFADISQADAMRIPTPGYLLDPSFLIENAGLKGTAIGDMVVATTNANFIVNKGAAKADDAIKLIQLVQKEVKKKFAVRLESIIQYVGFDN